MNYKLVKKLKKAKFPFDFKESKMGDDTYTYPSLEDLKKACGDDFDFLNKMNFAGEVWWQAYMTEEAFDKMGIMCVRDCCGYEVGDTESEAVAYLWLMLNKKI